MTSDYNPTVGGSQGTSGQNGSPLNARVYLMDLWCFLPYYTARLCASLREQGVDVRLGSVRHYLNRDYFRSAGVSKDRWLLDVGGSIRTMVLRRIVKSLEYVVNLSLLGAKIAVSRPAILHVQYLPFLDLGFPFEIWFLLWARRHGIKIVYTIHNLTNKQDPDRHKELYARAYQAADLLVCHSQNAGIELERVFNIPAEKIKIIPHGPLYDDVPPLSPQEARVKIGLPVDELLVLAMGVIREYKGVPFLLEAWKYVMESGCKGQLLIAGTGDRHLMRTVQEWATREGFESSVHLWFRYVPVDQVPLLHQAADILVYPYKAGTTSGALLTGLNYGKAVVATNLPFFKEYLRDGENAFLVNYGDVKGLTSRLRILLEKPEERSRIAAVLQSQDTQRASWGSISRATRECYERLLREQEQPS